MIKKWLYGQEDECDEDDWQQRAAWRMMFIFEACIYATVNGPVLLTMMRCAQPRTRNPGFKLHLWLMP